MYSRLVANVYLYGAGFLFDMGYARYQYGLCGGGDDERSKGTCRPQVAVRSEDKKRLEQLEVY